MAITKEQILSDIQLQLLQSSPSDDSALELSQLAFWTSYHLNELVRREITAELKKGNIIPPIYVLREEALVITEETVADIDDKDQRMWVELDNDVLDLPRDRAIVNVYDYDLNLINKTSLEELASIKHLRFAAPSSENVLHYRQGKKIFLVGFNTPDLEFNEIIVDYIPKQDLITMDDEDEVLISDQLVPVLVDAVVQRGKLELYGTQPDESNNGRDNKAPVYHTQIASPASDEASQQTTEQ